ncbi:hypothetical protein ON010_g13696 [Phytophthora cinnamomi]|nr:hypothetical protein ON010_g13696 [Phytophthora cinnamomi]
MSPSPVFPAEDSDYAFAMDAASTTTSRINKFDGTNFHTWKFKMAMVLEERDLWEVTSGEIKLEHCATTLDQTTFKRKSRKALAIICLAMEDSQLPLVRSAKDAYDAWSKLEGHFEKKSLANKLFLRRRFFTTMMAEGDDVLEHVNKIKTLVEQLDAVGALVSEADLVITLLASQSESYQFLIIGVKSRFVDVSVLKEPRVQAFMTSGKEKSKGRQAQKISAGRCCGATQHVTYSKEYMKNYKNMTPVDVHLADDGVVQAVGSGDTVTSMKTPHGIKKGVITGVWHILKLSRNLFSVGRFTKDVGPLGAREGKELFKLCMTPAMPGEANEPSLKERKGDTTSYLWHFRHGHIGQGGLDAIVKKGYGVGVDMAVVKQ